MKKLNEYTINALFFALQCAGMYLSLQLLFWALDVPDGVDVWEAIAAAFAILACNKFMRLKLNNK